MRVPKVSAGLTPAVVVPVLLALVGGCGDDSSGNQNNAIPAICGNGEVEPGEECDEGSANSDTRPDACRTDCRQPRCGDGVTDSGEACDDGNEINEDGCLTACRSPGECCVPNVCGDGIPDLRPAGDGSTVEACDDGNNADGDRCRSDCGQDLLLCGNGTIDQGETCDLGYGNSDEVPDACRTDCQPARCGDGVRDAGEECDGEPPCDAACQWIEQCGDGWAVPGEACDDGNAAVGDGCTPACEVEPNWVCEGLENSCRCGPFLGGARCDECVVYVDSSPALTQRDGATWATALSGVRAGVDVASSRLAASDQCEVWVASGVYPVYQHTPLDTIPLITGVSLFGGFAGWEQRRGERDLAAGDTVLDGAHATDPDLHVHHVVTASFTVDATLDGFVIVGGDAREAMTPAGGGILIEESRITVSNCTVRENRAEQGGGVALKGMGLSGSFGDTETTLSNCLIVDNEATQGGGAHLALYSPSLVNCTLAGNSATDSGGGLALVRARPSLGNSILWGNSPDTWTLDESSLPAARYSLIQGGWPGQGNLDEDPLFVDPGGGDYRLQPGSPAIDAADGLDAPPSDRQGRPRFDVLGPTGSGQPPFADLGALEHSPCTAQSERCHNGRDDDGDGLTDCADPDCAGCPCGPYGRLCGAGSCACPEGALETACHDNADNDCDGLVDCADPDCQAVTAETDCTDGLDNDCDGVTDCGDPDCATAGSCEPVETLCGDGLDNDGDGAIDGRDYLDCRTTWWADGLDADADGWTLEGDWERGVPTGWQADPRYGSGEPPTGYSGNHCLGTAFGRAYAGGAPQRAISPPIGLAGASAPFLVFLMWRNFAADDLAAFVEITTDDVSYVKLENPSRPYNTSFWIGHEAWAGTMEGDGGQATSWELVSFDLTPWVGETVRISFTFYTDPPVSPWAGWYIDDPAVLERAEVPVDIVTASRLSLALVGVAYSQPLDVLMTTGTTEWSLAAGGLNDGWLTTVTNGVLQGTPVLANQGDTRVIVRATREGDPTDFHETDFHLRVGRVVYHADFEYDPGWSLSGSWQVGSPTGDGPQYCHQGQGCLSHTLDGQIPACDWDQCEAMTPVLDLTAATRPMARFFAWVGEHQAQVRVTRDGGATSELARWVDPPYDWSSFTFERASFSPDMVWKQYELDLAAWAGDEIRLIFTAATGISTWPGWYIDDLVVYD